MVLSGIDPRFTGKNQTSGGAYGQEPLAVRAPATTDAEYVMTLSGRTALVTGAGRGIGRAVAIRLAAQGARSALVARTAQELRETVGLVEREGGTAVPIAADVSTEDGIRAVLDAAAEALGAVDVLVNNAGTVQPLGPAAEMDLERWTGAFAVNVFAPAALAFALVPGMVERGWGRVVNVSSGIVAHPAAMGGFNAYAATKAALEAHTLNLAAELKDTGVTVNVYRPGSVDTAMQAWIRERGESLVDAATHARFRSSYENQTLITADDSAASLVARIPLPETGRVWDASDRI